MRTFKPEAAAITALLALSACVSTPMPSELLAAAMSGGGAPSAITGERAAECLKDAGVRRRDDEPPKGGYSPIVTQSFVNHLYGLSERTRPYAGRVRAYEIASKVQGLFRAGTAETYCFFDWNGGSLRYLTYLPGETTQTEYNAAAIRAYVRMAGKSEAQSILLGVYGN